MMTPGTEELLLRCECGTECICATCWYPHMNDPDPLHYDIAIATSYDWSRSFKQRVKMAWRILRGKNNVWFHEAILYRDKAESLRDFLSQSLEKGELENVNNRAKG